MTVAWKQPGYHSVSPYLIIDGAAQAVAFYEEVFGARQRMCLRRHDGRLGHTEIEIGDSVVMLADPPGEPPDPAPAEAVSLHLYVPDVDTVFARAVAAGAVSVRPVETHFYGDRGGSLRDPFGLLWHLATHVEDVSDDEIGRRIATIKA